MEYIEGITLEQWIERNPRPDVHEVVQIMRQVARGLLALHRRDTLHQDLKPANIVLAADGTAKIIDLGSCSVAGIQEIAAPLERDLALGTLDYSAPEYRLGQAGDRRADYFSLGCICYEMLTGKLPYGAAFKTARGRDKLTALRYRPAYQHNPLVPVWMDGALRKSVRIEKRQRYAELSEWIADLEHPNPLYTGQSSLPLLEREPVLFWKRVSAALACALIVVMIAWLRHR
jgi:serine/threonine protein kinase